jgi:hypothetical protein
MVSTTAGMATAGMLAIARTPATTRMPATASYAQCTFKKQSMRLIK